MIAKKLLSIPCKHCGIVYSVMVWPEKFEEWENGGGYIQDLLSDLSAGERELLISGTCDNCWKLLFGNNDDDEEE